MNMHYFSKKSIKKLILCILANFWVGNPMVESIFENFDPFRDVTWLPGTKRPPKVVNIDNFARNRAYKLKFGILTSFWMRDSSIYVKLSNFQNFVQSVTSQGSSGTKKSPKSGKYRLFQNKSYL